MPDDAAAFVVVAGRWDFPLTQTEWHDVEAAELADEFDISDQAMSERLRRPIAALGRTTTFRELGE